MRDWDKIFTNEWNKDKLDWDIVDTMILFIALVAVLSFGLSIYFSIN